MYEGRDLSESNIEKVTRIIASSNFEDLTPETLLLAYEEEGIRSLEDLTQRLTEAIQDPKGRPQRLNYELFSKPTPREASATIEHKVPKVPFIVKGIEHDPEDIVRYNGRELCFIVDSRSEPDELIVLEDKAVWSSFLQMIVLANLVPNAAGYQYGGYHSVPGPRPATSLAGPEPIIPPPPEKSTSDVYMYSEPKLLGSKLELGPNLMYTDLTKKDLFAVLVNWNDEIESISPTISTCFFSEHIDHGGSKLFFKDPTLGSRDLATIGWDNRISSVWNMGFQGFPFFGT